MIASLIYLTPQNAVAINQIVLQHASRSHRSSSAGSSGETHHYSRNPDYHSASDDGRFSESKDSDNAKTKLKKPALFCARECNVKLAQKMMPWLRDGIDQTDRDTLKGVGFNALSTADSDPDQRKMIDCMTGCSISQTSNFTCEIIQNLSPEDKASQAHNAAVAYGDNLFDIVEPAFKRKCKKSVKKANMENYSTNMAAFEEENQYAGYPDY